jgi:hypothetical protein
MFTYSNAKLKEYSDWLVSHVALPRVVGWVNFDLFCRFLASSWGYECLSPVRQRGAERNNLGLAIYY